MRFRAAVVGGVVLCMAIGLTGCDWATFRYDPGHSGYNSTERAIGVGNVAQLGVRFIGDGNYGTGPLVVAKGIAYVGTGTNFLNAFSATGSTNCSGQPPVCEPMWRANLDVQTSSPAVANGVLYVAGFHTLYLF